MYCHLRPPDGPRRYHCQLKIFRVSQHQRQYTLASFRYLYHQIELAAKIWYFYLNFLGENPKILQQFVSAIYHYHLAKFGSLAFNDLRLQRLAKKQNAEFKEGSKMKVLLYIAVCRSKFTTFWGSIGEHLQFLSTFPDCLYHVLFERLLRQYDCLITIKVVKSSIISKIGSLWSPIFRRRTHPKFRTYIF